MISILSPEFIEYEFPKEKPLTKCVKDYLEKTVDKKYYISNEKAKKLIKDLQYNSTTVQQYNTPSTLQQKNQELLTSLPALRQDITREFVNTDLKEPVYMNLKRIDKRDCKIAATLCARDYKGFGTGFNIMNGVLEKL